MNTPISEDEHTAVKIHALLLSKFPDNEDVVNEEYEIEDYDDSGFFIRIGYGDKIYFD